MGARWARNMGKNLGTTIMRNILAALAVAVCCLPAAGGFAPAGAFGAIAVGETASGVAKDGVAMGWSISYSTQAEAEAVALKNCKNYKSAPKAALQCILIGDVKANQCFSIALDPKPGTPGVGWAIADDQSTADSVAMANCKVTAGSDRAQFCAVSDSKCDGK
jgi:hypothetical protein